MSQRTAATNLLEHAERLTATGSEVPAQGIRAAAARINESIRAA
jgi:hypothetical protein